MPSAWLYVVGLALIVLGLVFITLDGLLRRWHWLAERMPPGTRVPPRRSGFYRRVRVVRGYFVLAMGVLFFLDPPLR